MHTFFAGLIHLQVSRVWWLTLALALVLCSPQMWSGFVADDFIQQSMLIGSGPIRALQDNSVFGMFSLIHEGDATRLAELISNGVLPWWTHPDFAFAFWRPLAELSHALDFHLWGSNPVWMHAHNLLWFGACLLVVLTLYRRMMPTPLAVGVAFAMFALDSTHAPTLGWISNRSAVIACTLAMALFYCHLRYRSGEDLDSRRWIWRLASIVLLIPALLSGEYALGIGGYLLAFALCLDRAGPIKGLLCLWPQLVIVMLWAMLYKTGGFGTGSALNFQYVDPVHHPLAFFQSLLWRVPPLLFSQFGIIPAESFNAMEYFGFSGRAVYWLVCVVALGYAIYQFRAALLGEALNRFFILACLISLVPVCATIPMDRVLLLAGVAGSGLLGNLLAPWLPSVIRLSQSLKEAKTVSHTQNSPLKLARLLLILHLLVSPFIFPIAVASLRWQAKPMVDAAVELPHSSQLAGKSLVVLSGFAPQVNLLSPTRHVLGLPVPEQVWFLASNFQAVTITTRDEFTLVLEPEQGFLASWDATFRTPEQDRLKTGDHLDFPGLHITIESVENGLPKRVSFRFSQALSSGQLVFLRSTLWNLEPVTLPAMGKNITIPALMKG